MAKKSKEKLKEGFQKLYHDYKDRAMVLVSEFLADQAGNLVAWIKDVSRIKKMIRKCMISAIISVGAVAVLLLGISSLLAMYFPGIAVGWWQVIVGLVALLGVSMYMKN
jgi:hypothetical protein